MLAKHSAAWHLIENLLSEDTEAAKFKSDERNEAMVNAIVWNAERNVSVFLAAGCNPNYVTHENVHVLHITASHSFKCTQQLMASGSTFHLSQPYIGPTLAACHPDGNSLLSQHLQFKRDDNILVSPVDNAVLYDKFSVAKMLFSKYKMPPTYLNHDLMSSDILIAAIYKMSEKDDHWLHLVSDYVPAPRSLLHLCIETVSRMLGPVERHIKITQCQLPKTICNAILMEYVREDDFMV